MLFSSFVFIYIFLPIVGISYWISLKHKNQILSRVILVLSSLFFYSYYNPIYLPLILVSMLFNFYIGRGIGDAKSKIQKNSLFYLGIIFNLFLLGYFKYADFFIGNINAIFNSNFELLKLALPLAISFFTFQQIAYIVDSKKGITKHYNFMNYSLFVCFFPQLIAGPIVHHKEMMPQFEDKENLKINYKNVITGLFLFSIGIFKKAILADHFAQYVRTGYSAQSLDILHSWFTSLSYTFQLYFDFSGYCDMAIGIALLFNIKLPINFNSPYKSKNIQDFWNRWHITLGKFLKDYVYIPLGGNRKGSLRTYINLFLTFLLGGFWHGASWMFVIWGTFHGIAVVIHRIFSKTNIILNRFVSIIITFLFVNFTWIFFRAENMETAGKVLKGMVGIGENISNFNLCSKDHIILILSFIIIFFSKNSLKVLDENYKYNKYKLAFYIFLFLFSVKSIFVQEYQEFIYFNF
ncbi:MAG: MBOAT family protein [Alphaproteobacteria bacterium]|nr:MBOAT family protein [Alphaproteobacteria bacterium]